MAKLPINPPTLTNDTTSVASSKVNGPDENVLFSFWSSLKLIVAQPEVKPYDIVNKLPMRNEWNKYENCGLNFA